MHSVDRLKANILVGIDIIRIEDIVIDVPAKRVTIRSYKDVSFLIEVKRKKGKLV